MGTFTGAAGADSFDGGASDDTFMLQAGGNDSARGAGGADGFFFGGALTTADVVDGGAGSDTLALQGNYAGGLLLGDIRNVEVLLALSGSDRRFGASGTSRHSYNLTTADANIAAGSSLSVIATTLLSNENLTFNGAAESRASTSTLARLESWKATARPGLR